MLAKKSPNETMNWRSSSSSAEGMYESLLHQEEISRWTQPGVSSN